MVSIYLHFKFLNKCLFVRCGAYYIEIYHSVKYFLDKLFDILDKFYKLLIFNWLFFIIGILILDIGFGLGKPIKRTNIHPVICYMLATHQLLIDGRF